MAAQQLPLVSIITCFLNEERFLQETVESVLAQDYPHWELLLIDDGSSDKSTLLAKEYAARYPDKIFYHDHEGHSNKGLSASRNSGIKKVRGSLVAFLDADDVWLPQKLSQQVRLMEENPEVGMVCEASEYWHSWQPNAAKDDIVLQVGGGLPEGVYAPPQLLLILYPLGNTPAPCPSTLLCRKSMLDKIEGFEAHFTGARQMYEDQAFLTKVYVSEKIYISKACNNRYRQRAGSLVHAVTEEGKYHQVRLYYLEWLEEYLLKRKIRHAGLNKQVERAFLPYRQPLLHFLSDTLPAKGKNFIIRKLNQASNRAKAQDNGSNAGI